MTLLFYNLLNTEYRTKICSQKSLAFWTTVLRDDCDYKLSVLGGKEI